jgi:hypothetical protein
LLAGRHPVLGRYHAVRLNLLDAIGADLLTISDPGRRLLDTRGANLLAVGPHLHAVGARRPCYGPVDTLRPLDGREPLLLDARSRERLSRRRESLPLNARRLGALSALRPHCPATTALRSSLIALSAIAVATRTCSGRGRNRQGGDTCGQI